MRHSGARSTVSLVFVFYIAMLRKINETWLELSPGDITLEEVDAIVNAANSRLAGGGGVDGAIHSAGGPEIARQCYELMCRLKVLPVGKAVITGGGRLKAKYVIHAVGPIWRGGAEGEADALASAYRNSLSVAHENKLKSVAFPSISTGAYGYPLEKAAPVALGAVCAFIKQHSGFELVRFKLFGDDALRTYSAALEGINA